MAIKRLCKQQTMHPLKRLRLRLEDEEQPPNARLSTLPEDLQIRILSSLDTKHAFQTSLLSKAWSSKWTHVPVFNFNSRSFNNRVRAFDKFVAYALSVPRSVQLVTINFRRDGVCNYEMLKKVFDYAFKQRVEELNANIRRTSKETSWPIMSHTCGDSLRSLKLESHTHIACSYLGPRSGFFKNLTSLHLRKAIITDLDPFSRFPALKKLKLIFCQLQTDDYTLNVHASHLSELTISYCGVYVNQRVNLVPRCNITTPNLKYFKFRGCNFPQFEITRGLPAIDTVIIEYGGLCKIPQQKKLFDDLMIFFNVLCNVKSLTVYSSVVHILSLFPDELVNRCSPFQDLKSLKVDLSLFYRQKLFEGNCISLSEKLRHVSRVKGYLLQKSPDAKYTIIDPDAPLKEQYICSNSHECNCRLANTMFHIALES